MVICPRYDSEDIGLLSLSEFNQDFCRCQACFYKWTPDKHQGLATHRLEDNPLERKFAEAWEIVQQQGNILNYLLSLTNDPQKTTTTDRDIRVAATVIQWLGSHVGQEFLRYILGEDK